MKNIIIKCISMDDIPGYLKNRKIKFDKIISSYALYYAKNPIKVIRECSKSLKPKGKFLITAPCYPHTLTEFALKQKTLPDIAKKYIDFSSKQLEVFLKLSKCKTKIYNFKNTLKFRNLNDLLDFYRSTIFYNKKSEFSLSERLTGLESVKAGFAVGAAVPASFDEHASAANVAPLDFSHCRRFKTFFGCIRKDLPFLKLGSSAEP